MDINRLTEDETVELIKKLFRGLPDERQEITANELDEIMNTPD